MNISVFFRDSRPKIDPKDITIEELKGETVGRLPGTINGTEFIIRNCEVRFLLHSAWSSILTELLPSGKIGFGASIVQQIAYDSFWYERFNLAQQSLA